MLKNGTNGGDNYWATDISLQNLQTVLDNLSVEATLNDGTKLQDVPLNICGALLQAGIVLHCPKQNYSELDVFFTSDRSQVIDGFGMSDAKALEIREKDRDDEEERENIEHIEAKYGKDSVKKIYKNLFGLKQYQLLPRQDPLPEDPLQTKITQFFRTVIPEDDDVPVPVMVIESTDIEKAQGEKTVKKEAKNVLAQRVVLANPVDVEDNESEPDLSDDEEEETSDAEEEEPTDEESDLSGEEDAEPKQGGVLHKPTAAELAHYFTNNTEKNPKGLNLDRLAKASVSGIKTGAPAASSTASSIGSPKAKPATSSAPMKTPAKRATTTRTVKKAPILPKVSLMSSDAVTVKSVKSTGTSKNTAKRATTTANLEKSRRLPTIR
uniref:NPL domain-containing protein n=1 Tax=Steinernema glaseri TaxID=37863 RepID=A0A1I7XWB2_9BILA